MTKGGRCVLFQSCSVSGTQLWAQRCGLRDTDLGVTSIEVVHNEIGLNGSLGNKNRARRELKTDHSDCLYLRK